MSDAHPERLSCAYSGPVDAGVASLFGRDAGIGGAFLRRRRPGARRARYEPGAERRFLRFAECSRATGRTCGAAGMCASSTARRSVSNAARTSARCPIAAGSSSRRRSIGRRARAAASPRQARLERGRPMHAVLHLFEQRQAPFERDPEQHEGQREPHHFDEDRIHGPRIARNVSHRQTRGGTRRRALLAIPTS